MSRHASPPARAAASGSPPPNTGSARGADGSSTPAAAKKKRRKKRSRRPGAAAGAALPQPRPPACSCRLTLGGQATTCNAAAAARHLGGFEDRLVGAINGAAELSKEWAGVVARGQEYLTRFANLLLDSEQLHAATFAGTVGAAGLSGEPPPPLSQLTGAGGGRVTPALPPPHDGHADGGGSSNSSENSGVASAAAAAAAAQPRCGRPPALVLSATVAVAGGAAALRARAAGKRGQMLAGVQQSLFALHDRLVGLQRRRAALVRGLVEDVDCCDALALQACTKPGARTASDPVFKTLGLADFHRLLARMSAMYEQELVLKRLLLADFPRSVDRARLTHYISSWTLEPQIDADFVAHYNDVVRAETRAAAE